VVIQQALQLMVENGASDVHLLPGSPPAFRIHGKIQFAEGLLPVTGEALMQELEQLLDKRRVDSFRQDMELDFALEIEGAGRFRGNAAWARGRPFLVFRHITELTLDFEALGLPAIYKDLAMTPRGLVIVTGPVGSGKSTTLAAFIQYINAHTNRRVVTLEDPIEYLFHNERSIITQREIGHDSRSFIAALGRVLRQDPDVIMVGETRDAATVEATLIAAETGHLVLNTAHAPSAPQSVERIIGMFPPHQQTQVTTQLASVLEGVLYQELLPKANGTGRAVAVEVMLGTYAVKNMIREGKVHQLYSVIQTGGQMGMRTMDEALLQLCRKGVITEELALARAQNRDALERDLRGAVPGAAGRQVLVPTRPGERYGREAPRPTVPTPPWVTTPKEQV
jgi:twitching motility protein PilT